MTGMEILGIALMIPLLIFLVIFLVYLVVGFIAGLYEEAGILGIIVPIVFILGFAGACILDNEKQKRMQVEANEPR